MRNETIAEGRRTTESAMKYQARQYFAHRMYYNIIFENEDMDYFLQWMLASEANCGCSTGEVFYAASQIEDGNFGSWRKVMGELAQRVEARAEASLAKGHNVSAREGFLRASNYYRWSVIHVDCTKPGGIDDYVKSQGTARACFQKAGPLFNPPIEPIDIPYEGKSLPGYFWKAGDDKKKRKTFIMIGGGETVAEDMFFYLGPHAAKRGYNFVTADLPGQGITPNDGFPFRADSEIPMGAILDYVLDRPEVDSERVASAGQSLGGYFVPRAACFDKRIKACSGNAVVCDVEPAFGQHVDNLEANVTKRDASMGGGTTEWRFNVKTIHEIKDSAMTDYTFDPAQLACPVLIVVGEGEYQSKLMQQQTEATLMAAQDNRNSVVIPPLNEGGAHHCTWENTYLAAQITFDWLDELFD